MILNKFNLNDKVAIVTGASTGLGRGMAMGLAEAGANIVAVATRDMEDLKKEIEAFGVKCFIIQADLKTLAPIEDIVTKTVANFGRIDVLVNNAGIIRREDSIDFSENNWDDVININLKTLFFLSQRVAKEFIKQGRGGKIINIASMLSFQGGIRVPSYTASKSAVRGITMTMANEWAKYGINVNAIAPGYMETDNTFALRQDEKRNKEILDRIPANRWGTPNDLKGIVVFLASPASDYIHGATIPVDGGWLGR